MTHPVSGSWAFCLLTFGCKVNQYESEALREAWQGQDGHETDDPSRADVVVCNSCAITASAVADLRQALRRVRRANATALLLITGCAAELPANELAFAREPAFAPLKLVRQSEKSRLLAADFRLTTADGRRAAELSPDSVEQDRQRARLPFPAFHIHGFRRARPVLKVQDGCSHHCAYCIVPQTRGLPRSRSVDESVAEARRLLEAGHREIMISGINLRQFRMDGQDFWDLVARLDTELAPQWLGKARLRISSVDPAQLDTKGLDTLAASRMVCPHLHLSLQSGSPAVLTAMRRAHYTPEQVLTAVEALGTAWPRFGLGADVLMGFPGEEERHVQETLACINALPLSYAHVFPFSERPGTAAATMPGAVPRPERQHRAARVREAVQLRQNMFLQAHLSQQGLLVAPDGDGSLRGVDQYYVACTLDRSPKAGDHALIAVRPVAVRAAALLVRIEN